jgi:para-nitrobenzyl esterase
MASPLAAGLFARVIGQSSAGISRPDGPMRTLAQAEAAGVAFAKAAGARELAELRSMSAVELAAAAGHFNPIVDGRVLACDTEDAFDRGAQLPVPLLVGSNTDEGSIYTPAAAAAALAELAGRMEPGHVFHQAYPTGEAAVTRRSARLFTGETRFVWPVWRWAAGHARTSPASVWVYRFHREPPLPPIPGLASPPDGDPGYGAFHSAELPYIWDTLGQHDWPWTDADHALALTMSATWARFVRTADPNGGTLPQWPQFSGKAEVMHFGETVHAGPVDRLTAMQVLDDPSTRAQSHP